jgi:hypothetical protein
LQRVKLLELKEVEEEAEEELLKLSQDANDHNGSP